MPHSIFFLGTIIFTQFIFLALTALKYGHVAFIIKAHYQRQICKYNFFFFLLSVFFQLYKVVLSADFSLFFSLALLPADGAGGESRAAAAASKYHTLCHPACPGTAACGAEWCRMCWTWLCCVFIWHLVVFFFYFSPHLEAH